MKLLTELVNKVWESETVRDEWQQVSFFPYTKARDQSQTARITLLSAGKRQRFKLWDL